MSAYVYLYSGVCIERLSISEYVYSITIVKMSTLFFVNMSVLFYTNECVYVYSGVCLERLPMIEYVYSIILVNKFTPLE